MSQEQEKRDRGRLQHEAEHARPRKKVSVLGYMTILFAAAFLLLLLSYFMQQRSSQDTIDGLKDSMNALQTAGDLVEQNKALHEQVSNLEEQLDGLKRELSSAQQEQGLLEDAQLSLENQLAAMDWLWRIQRAWSRGARSECRDLVNQFEDTSLPDHLPRVAVSSAPGPSPAEQYAALLDAMGMAKAEP